MSTVIKLIDLTDGSEPCLLGRSPAELLCGLPELSASPENRFQLAPTGYPVAPQKLRAMLSYINPTFDGGNGTWVGIAKALLYGQLPVLGEVDWEVLLDDWCSGALWRKRTGDEAFNVPTYQGREELLRRLSGAPRASGPAIGIGTIIKLAREGGYKGEVGLEQPQSQEAPISTGDDTEEIRRLAAMPRLAYERERQAAATRLGFRVGVLDELVEEARPPSENQTGQGRALELHDPEPWPETVPGEEVLNELSTAIRRYVVMDVVLADSIALWVLASYCFDCFSVFPRLAVLSPEKQCGKTTLLDGLTGLVSRPLPAANVSAASVFRIIELMRPTLLVDEADTFLKDNEELRGVLNSGHRRGGMVLRCVGDNADPRAFSTWAPAVIAAIGRLPATLEDRSILISLRRRRKDEPVARLRLDRTHDLSILARKAARWAEDNMFILGDTEPEMPEELFNRSADNWRPLLAIAKVAGGEWPQRARAAARVAVHTNAQSDDQSMGVLLLNDMKTIFAGSGYVALYSEDIVVGLVAMEDRPWADFRQGKPITKVQVARLLKPFGVSPVTVRRSDQTAKGYKKSALDDAFERYLPDQDVTPSQPNENTSSERLAPSQRPPG